MESPFKVLIVDDEPAILDFTKKFYDRVGYVTFGTANGLEAVEIFRRERTDVNFIDVHMPFSPIDGVEVLRRIKEIEAGAQCIMLSRINEPEPIRRSRELGALHYILKPFDIEALDRYIEEIKAGKAERKEGSGQP
jgi:CheY-like chemotaxis protein